MPCVVSVAVGLGLHKRFDYAVPSELEHVVAPGMRALVPFGPRRITGYILEKKDTSSFSGSLKPLSTLLDEQPVFNTELLDFVRWAATYYQTPLGELLKAALPPSMSQQDEKWLFPAPEAESLGLPQHPLFENLSSDGITWRGALRLAPESTINAWLKEGLIELRRVVRRPQARPRMTRMVLATQATREPIPPDVRGAARRKVIELLRVQTRIAMPDLVQQVPTASAAVTWLAQRGLLEIQLVRDSRTPKSILALEDCRWELNSCQRKAVDTITESLTSGRFSPYLLFGVTGSGKTEVYMHLIEACLAAGRTALVLVPEIALTPQLMARFEARFSDSVAILHSALTPGERLDGWSDAATGRKSIVLGARSAIFAPLPNLGLIIVDEEHEPSYKQETPPHYNARDLALARASLAGCTAVLGSATPSLEMWHKVRNGGLTRVDLPNRATPRPLPDITLIDLRYQRFVDPDRIISESLFSAIRETIASRNQVILFINRKGYAPFLICEKCGSVPSCEHCSVSLTYYKRDSSLRCHYCLHHQVAQSICAVCGSPELRVIGAGTERVEERLAEQLPDVRMARIDASLDARRKVPALLAAFSKGELDLLVGTQILAKGHDFPNVTLVGVLNADLSLKFPDIRSTERTFQLLTQVAGRAGRGRDPGRVLIQTYMPEHTALAWAQRQDFESFASEELDNRRQRQLPPFTVMALVRLSGPSLERTLEAADTLAYLLNTTCARLGLAQSVSLAGPVAAPLAKVQDSHRIHILLTAHARKDAQYVLRTALQPLAEQMARFSNVRWSIDVDPMSIM